MLRRISEKEETLVIGLMSGTSADGIDSALVKFKGHGLASRINLIAYHTLRFNPQVKNMIIKAQDGKISSLKDIVILNSYLGELFAYAAKDICTKGKVAVSAIDIIGSHGQTICHYPDPIKLPGFNVTGTMQIGEGSIIAERTGITTVCDFRPMDMAAGGQGAPLAPLLDYILYNHRSRSRIALNIGGIANVTGMPADAPASKITAFDTGPGNCLIDLVMKHFSDGKTEMDESGKQAFLGRVNDGVLSKLMAHPFLKKQPPKSVDKAAFGESLLKRLLEWSVELQPSDIIATVSHFTASSIALGIIEHLMQSSSAYEEVIVSGGGAKNKFVIQTLQKLLSKLAIIDGDQYYFPGKAKEAVLMALLANETIHGAAGNIPSATGASHPVVLGKIIPGRNILEEETEET